MQKAEIGVLLFLITLTAALGQAEPSHDEFLINEFLALNDSGITDEDGEFNDWIELANGTDADINLDGYYLTDDATNMTQWRFPSVTLPARSFLLVFASGKDRIDPEGELHTNFRLSGDGEYLALVMPDGVGIVSAYGSIESNFPPQRDDVSYGYRSGREEYFTSPTPNAPNNAGVLGFVDDVAFSVDHGFHEDPFTLALSTPTEDAVIRYTTDGAEPSIGNLFGGAVGTVYTAPIEIDQTTVVRAKAFKTSWAGSVIGTRTYLFVEDVIRQSPTGTAPESWPSSSVNGQVFNYGMDPEIVDHEVYGPLMIEAMRSIPSMSIVTDQKHLTSVSTGIYVNASQDGVEWERPASLELLNPDGSEGFQENAGLRIRGGFSRAGNNPKHSFRLFFRREYGAGTLQFPLFGDEGVDRFDKIDFRTAQNYAWSNTGNDGSRNTFLREIFARDSQRAMGKPYTRSRYYHLYLNGQYWGLFMTQERAEARFAESYFGGSEEEYDVVKVEAGPYTVYATDGQMDDYNALHAIISGGVSDELYFELQGKHPDGRDNPEGIRHVDVDNLIDYMLVIFYVGSWDAPMTGDGRANNFYGIRNRVTPDGWKFFAHDTEHSMLNVNENRLNPPNLGAQLRYFTPQWLHQQLMGSDEYRLRFGDRVEQFFFNNGVLMSGPAADRWNARRQEIELAIIGESARWGDFRQTRPFSKQDWDNEVQSMVDNYFPNRSNIVLNQIQQNGLHSRTVATPRFNQHGGEIEDPDSFLLRLTAGTLFDPQPGEIVYTLDGSDPRILGGDRSPSALVYDRTSSGISLAHSATVSARLHRESGEWSHLLQASFSIGSALEIGMLAISEIMYHPAEAGDGETFDDKNAYEYLELTNLTSTSLDLTGAQFTTGITLQFLSGATLAPGERVVIVSNEEAFRERYGDQIRILGQYEGQLSNSGEALALENADGVEILSFAFSDTDGWPIAADGEGFSLVLRNPSGDLDDPSNWRVSLGDRGNPGESDSESWSAWRVRYGLTDSSVADMDGDRIPDRIEYALGLNPVVPDASAPLAVEVTGGILRVSYQRSLSADEADVTISLSDDLAEWADGNARFTLVDRVRTGDVEELGFEASIEGGEELPSFLRLETSS